MSSHFIEICLFCSSASPPPPWKAVSHGTDKYVHLRYLVNGRMSAGRNRWTELSPSH